MTPHDFLHLLWGAKPEDQYILLWEWPDKQPGAPRLTEKWRSQLEEAVGWLPRDTIPAWDHELRKIIHDAEGKMANAGDYSSEAAKDLQGTIGQIHDFLGKPRPRSWKLGRLTRLSQQ